MWDFRFSMALRLMMRTAPYVLIRIVVYFGIAAAIVLLSSAGARIGYGIGSFGDDEFRASAAVWGSIGLTAGVLFFLREYILYVAKAQHIAVLVEVMDGRELPSDQGQIAYGSRIVRERFVQARVLFGFDQRIKGVIRAITGLMAGIASVLPIPGLDNLLGIFRALLKVPVGFVDEVVHAHAIRTRADNPWAAAEEALVLYGQNDKAMLRNAEGQTPNPEWRAKLASLSGKFQKIGDRARQWVATRNRTATVISETCA